MREIPVDEEIDGSHHTPDERDMPARIDLSGALARLSVDDRTLVALRYGADLDSAEIARALGGTPGSVRVRLHRLLRRLREDLKHD